MGSNLKIEPLRVTPPSDLSQCLVSDNLEDSCKTLCKICEKPYPLTQMRNHTKTAHGLQITKYKEIYGPFEILQVVWHSCHLCGKLVLLDSDALGGHIKGTHKMKEKDYKDKYCVYVKQKSMTPQPSERDDGSRNIAKRKQSGQIEEDFEPPQKKQKSLADIEEQIEGSQLDSTTGKNAPSRQVRKVGGLKESGVRSNVATVKGRKRGGALSPPSKSRFEDASKSGETSLVETFGGVGRELVSNRRINALKTESRAFRRGDLGDDMGQTSGKKLKSRPQERRYKALNLVNTENGADSRRKIEESDDDFDPFVDVEYDCNLKDCQECGKVSLVIRLSQLEQRQLKESQATQKRLDFSGEDLLADEEHDVDGGDMPEALTLDESGGVIVGRSSEPIAIVPEEKKNTGSEASPLSTESATQDGDDAEGGSKPLCSKRMSLLKDTCLQSELLSPSFDLSSSESELSDDLSSSSEEDDLEEEIVQRSREQEDEVQQRNSSPPHSSALQVDTISEGEVEVDETHPSSVDELSVEIIGEEVMPEDPKFKSGWQKWGKGYIWTRGGQVGTSTLEEG